MKRRPPITLESIKERVKQIAKRDPEGAHAAEDDLYLDFIKYVAKCGHCELSLMASVVLKTQKIEFKRITA